MEVLRCGLPATTNISSMFGIEILCLIQNEDTLINKTSHLSYLIVCNRCLDTLTSVIVVTISWIFFCNAIDNSFSHLWSLKYFFIKCRAKTNLKGRNMVSEFRIFYLFLFLFLKPLLKWLGHMYQIGLTNGF